MKAIMHYPELPGGDDNNEKVWTFAEVGCPEAKFGDLIQCGNYRDTKTYIVGKDNVLLKNPDRSNSGYLSIPYEITQYLTDALGKYSDQEVHDIDLRHDDVFLTNWFGTVPEDFQDFKFRWIAVVKCVNITFPNGIRSDFYPTTVKRILDQEKTHSLDDVRAFYEGTKGPRCRVTMTYTISPENMERFEAKYSNRAEVNKEIAELEEQDKKNSAENPALSVGFGGVLPNIHSVLIPKSTGKTTKPTKPAAGPSDIEGTSSEAVAPLAPPVPFAFPSAPPAGAGPAPSFAGFGFGAAPVAAAAPTTDGSPAPSFGGLGFGVASVNAAPSPPVAPFAFPSAPPAGAPPAPAFPTGFGSVFGGGASFGDGPSMAFMMKKIKLEASVRYQEPETPPTFSRYQRRAGMTAFGKMATYVYEGPKSDLDLLLSRINAFYDTFSVKTEVEDL